MSAAPMISPSLLQQHAGWKMQGMAEQRYRVTIIMGDGSRGVHEGSYPDGRYAYDLAMEAFPEARAVHVIELTRARQIAERFARRLRLARARLSRIKSGVQHEQ